ncbi:MAG: sarcosine oxidase subunit gamma [Pseudomonadota bacterium]|nr:sarcosine oxidase subunit gamma [Pseudomonadota bacterium]
MTDLTPITALGAEAPRARTFGPLTITEVADLGLASLALRKRQSAPTVFGLSLPEPGKAVTGDTASAFWTGPGQWMIEGPGQGDSDFAARVKAEAPEASVTEQTDGFTAFDVVAATSDQIDALMAKLVNVDLSRFTMGHATRTGLHHMTVFIIRRADTRLAVIGMRTLADAVWHALSDAAKRLEV